MTRAITNICVDALSKSFWNFWKTSIILDVKWGMMIFKLHWFDAEQVLGVFLSETLFGGADVE